MTKKEFLKERKYENGPIPDNLVHISQLLEQLKICDPNEFVKYFYIDRTLIDWDKPCIRFSDFWFFLLVGRAIRKKFGRFVWLKVWQAATVRVESFKKTLMELLELEN